MKLPVGRWLLLLTLLVAELVAVTQWFDTHGLASQQAWWAKLIRAWPLATQLLLAAAAATVVFGGSRLRDELQRVSQQLRLSPIEWLCLPAHVASLVATSFVTGHILDGGAARSTYPGLWTVLLVAMALLTLGLWLCLVIPVRTWPGLLYRGRSMLALGVIVGGGAFAAGQFTATFWRPLSAATLHVVSTILTWIIPDTVCQPDRLIVGSQRFYVQIAAECSGYQGIGLIVVFLAAFVFLYRQTLRFPRALLLLPIGAAVIWIANSLRITALILLGTWFSPVVALGSFHSLAGWIAFIGVILGLVLLVQNSAWFCVDGTSRELAAANPVSPLLGPLVAGLATGMVTGAFFQDFDPLYAVSVAVSAGVLWHFRRAYCQWNWGFDWTSVALGVAAYGLWVALIGSGPRPEQPAELGSALHRLPDWAAGMWIAMRIVGAVVTVPLAEELTFRAFLMRRLIAGPFEEVPIGKFSWFSFFFSSLLFGAMHHTVIAGTAAGMLYAVALYRRGRISDAVVAHATTNALIAVQVLTTGAWHLWN